MSVTLVCLRIWVCGIFCTSHLGTYLLTLQRCGLSIRRCRKLPKALKEWGAYLELKKKIDDFNESCPLLEMMAQKAMMDRHWERIAKLTGHTFDLESDNFALRNIMEAPLLQYKEDIEVGHRVLYPFAP